MILSLRSTDSATPTALVREVRRRHFGTSAVVQGGPSAPFAMRNYFLPNKLSSDVNKRESSLDLPEPLRGTDTESFAYHTIVHRWPRIAGRVIEENDFSSATNDRIRTLQDEVQEGAPIRPIEDPGAPDEALWRKYTKPYRGDSWLEVPWFFGEFYFYRRLLEATGYFSPGPGWRRDPFSYQKEKGLEQASEGSRALAQGRMQARDQSRSGREDVARLLQTALWGNQADLSMWAAEEEAPDHLGTDQEEERLLINDTTAALDHLDRLDRSARIDVWADNAGFELVTDLALVDGLLTLDEVRQVVIHLKVHPTFVSDATIDDVHNTLRRFAEAENSAVSLLAERLRRALATGRLRLQDAWAWTSPLRARELPASVRAELGRSDLLLSKGDANYRRLLGDRHWDFSTSFSVAAASLPVPVLALRTLKSEVAAGLSREQIQDLEANDPDWLVDGEWGVMQFAPMSGAKSRSQ